MQTNLAFDVDPLARLLKALADPTRLRIVGLLSHEELCVCHLQEALGLSQPNISRHLRILRLAGVVGDDRKGTWVYYRLLKQGDPRAEDLVRSLMRALPPQPRLLRKLRHLVKSRGPDACS